MNVLVSSPELRHWLSHFSHHIGAYGKHIDFNCRDAAEYAADDTNR